MSVSITLDRLSFASATKTKQLVSVYVRLTADPDVPGSYTLVQEHAQVSATTGNFLPPVVIDGLLENTSYTVKVVSECSNMSFNKEFVSPYENHTTSISYNTVNGGAVTPVANSVAEAPSTVTAPGVFSSGGILSVSVSFSFPYVDGLTFGQFVMPPDLNIDTFTHNLVTGNWDVEAHFSGLVENVFVIQPPVYFTTSIVYKATPGGPSIAVTNTAATSPAVVVSPGVISAPAGTVNVAFSFPYISGVLISDFEITAGLTLLSAYHNMITGNWDVTASYDGASAHAFVIEPPVRLVTTLSYGVFLNNVLQAPASNAMSSPSPAVAKDDNTHLSYYAQPAAIPIVLILPMTGVNPGDVCPFILSPNITVLTNIYNPGDNCYHVSATIPGDQDNLIVVTLPAFVATFNLDGDRMMNYLDTDLLEGAYYWEYQNVDNPTHNFGYGYRFCTTVRLRFNKIPVLTPGDAFLDEYTVPVGLTVVSSAVVGSFYVVEFSFSGQMNQIFDLTTIA